MYVKTISLALYILKDRNNIFHYVSIPHNATTDTKSFLSEWMNDWMDET